MQIKISVVIPTYKRPQLLFACLSSLISQTFDKSAYEVIVVSDGPDSETELVVKKFAGSGSSFLYLYTPSKKGPAAARNIGWQSASGKLIAFTDDDCLPDPTWLSDLWNAHHGEAEIAYTGKIKVPLSDRPTDYEMNTANLEKAEFVTANCCCAKEALLRTGGFDERFSMAWREDSDLEFKLLEHHIPIVRLENALVVHPVRKAPWAVSIKEQKKGLFNALLYKKYPDLYREKIQSSPPWNYYLMIVAFTTGVIGVAINKTWIAVFCLIAWLVLLTMFIAKRLSQTSRSWNHVAEMIVTSVFIPFVSVYWQIVGAWKYRVLFL